MKPTPIDPAELAVLGQALHSVAVEMGATVKDLAMCVHPHPTLSETLMEAAEVYFGQATHTLSRKRPE